jgi:hypothetical protein
MNSSGGCTCAFHETLRALDSSLRAGDEIFTGQVVAEAGCRHRVFGVGRLTSSLRVCSGEWIILTTTCRLPRAEATLSIQRARVAQPQQTLVADFITHAQYEIVDEARRAVGKNLRSVVEIGQFYSTLLDIFGDVVANCRGSAELANAIISDARAGAARIVRGSDPAWEIAVFTSRMEEILGDGLCLAA